MAIPFGARPNGSTQILRIGIVIYVVRKAPETFLVMLAFVSLVRAPFVMIIMVVRHFV
jgi:hypothetical protein